MSSVAVRLGPVLVVVAVGLGAAQPPVHPRGDWPTAAPESVGLDARALAAFDADIRAGAYGNVDSLLVIRHGKIAFDQAYAHDYDKIYGTLAKQPGPLNARDPSGPYNYFNPWWHPFYRRGPLHSLQSVTKTITSVTVGASSTRGEFPAVDTPILKFFDEKKVANLDDRKRRITIRHLLTMTGGFDWNENLPYADPNNSCSVMEASDDWVRFAIDRPMAEEPGRKFNYNSGQTVLLGHIFRVATGHDIEEYAANRLFAPLGIRDFYWKRIPSGLADTEGGLYLERHDLAKIWQLYLNRGLWQGKRVVSREWVEASVAPAADTGAGGRKYGYKWGLVPYGDKDPRIVWAGSGFGGQIPLVFPDLDLVVVATGWNILDEGKHLTGRHVVDRVLRSVKGATPKG